MSLWCSSLWRLSRHFPLEGGHQDRPSMSIPAWEHLWIPQHEVSWKPGISTSWTRDHCDPVSVSQKTINGQILFSKILSWKWDLIQNTKLTTMRFSVCMGDKNNLKLLQTYNRTALKTGSCCLQGALFIRLNYFWCPLCIYYVLLCLHSLQHHYTSYYGVTQVLYLKNLYVAHSYYLQCVQPLYESLCS